MSDRTGSQLWLVRHGETEWSRDGRHTSVTDLPLTPVGEQQAAALVEPLGKAGFGQQPDDLVLSSPRLRARQTAAIAGFEEPEIDPDLAEWAYGDYEGRTTAEIREEVPGWTIWLAPTPGGEAPAEVAERADRVIARARAHAGRTLVFAHGHLCRVVAARWLELPASEGRLFRSDTASISELGYEREDPVLLRWNVLP